MLPKFDYGNLRRHYAGLRRHYVDLRIYAAIFSGKFRKLHAARMKLKNKFQIWC